MGKKVKYEKRYLSFKDAQGQDSILKQIVDCIDFAIKNFSITNRIEAECYSKFQVQYKESYKNNVSEFGEKKLDLEFKEKFQNPDKIILRDPSYDREYNLDTVIINDFSREHDKDVEKAIVHVGSYADEYARSMRALAFTIANHIYFRNGAYKPESEEGRKLIAHELTHVAQNKLKNENLNTTKEELEKEAEKEEIKEERETEQYVTYWVGAKKYKIKKQYVNKINDYKEQYIENWIKMQEDSLSSEEYLELLINYKKYYEGQK